MHSPNRMCVACRQIKPKAELIRVVRQGKLVYDKAHKLEGRGAYLCKSEKCLEKAFKKNMFYHKLRQPFEQELYEEIKKALNE